MGGSWGVVCVCGGRAGGGRRTTSPSECVCVFRNRGMDHDRALEMYAVRQIKRAVSWVYRRLLTYKADAAAPVDAGIQ